MSPASIKVSGPPLPPPDFAARKIPVYEINLALTDLKRIHRSAHGPIFFNRASLSSQVYRFDAPADEYGVLYASESFSACMAETIIRSKFENQSKPLMLSVSADLAIRSISLLGQATPRILRLADFTQPLFGLGFTAEVLSDPLYTASRKWSKVVFAHPDQFDGIYFRSRYANEPSIALFDRSRVVQRGSATPLLSWHELGPFLDKYDILLVP
jgi:hypothetical protein